MAQTPIIDPTPWYRQLWPWLVMFPPAVAVVGGIITLTLAIRTADGVVVADYYRQGRAINQRLERSEAAAAMGLQASIDTRGLTAGDEVRVRLIATEAIAPEASLKLRLIHPGRSGADRQAMLARVAVHDAGRQVDYVGHWQDSGAVAGLVNWRLVIEARDWRLDGDASMISAGTPLQVRAGH